ncbi:MAG: acyl-[ACP]--phospholipid O-acyltransferase [Planctomycetaceae bacterium]|nr:acyl-[ACP]--phospholipid O-acyltransferase [Planctomycetaceae bacterium]
MSVDDSPDALDLEPSHAAPVRLHAGVGSTSFIALLIVQFCTALNDHTFRWLVVPIAKPIMGDAAALSLGLAGFTLPFIVLAMPAGYLADRFSKGQVITFCKLVEIVLLGLGLATLMTESPLLLFIVVAATGALAALFAPSKVGSIPELVSDGELTTANGLMGMMNVVPCALGFLIGNWLSTIVQPHAGDQITVAHLLPAAALIMTIAIVGWVASLLIQRIPSAAPERPIPWRFLAETGQALRQLSVEPNLMRAALGITFFWMMASLANINIDTFGIHDLGLQQADIGILGMVLVIGVGAGSLLAGWWSGGHIELGFVPLGAFGISVCSLLLFFTGKFGYVFPNSAFYGSCLALFGLGVSAGLFDVPLEAYLQHRSPPQALGTVLAATNFLVFFGTLLVAGVFYLLNEVLAISAGTIFLLAGLGTVAVGLFIAWQLPAAVFRMVWWLFARLVYRIHVYGRENIPREGGVLLVPNHVTWVDGILLLVTAPRPIRFIAYADFVNHPRLAWLARIFEVIPIKSDGGPKALIQSLRVAREAIEQGSCVCIFAEGTLTRTGQVQPFQPGFLKIIQGTGAPVIPVCLHGLWGSIFSYRGGKFFWKWPRKLPYPVSILFGEPILNPQSVEQVRSAVNQLGNHAVENDKAHLLNAPRQMIRICRKRWQVKKIVDSLGTEMTGGRLLTASLAMRRVLLRHVKSAEAEPRIGIYMPSTVGGVLANVAVAMTGRVSVNLNFTLHESDLQYIVRDAELKTMITSKAFMEKKPANLGVPLLYLEDMKTEVTGVDKVLAALAAGFVPAFILDRWLGLTRLTPDDPITIIYTSGSTGEPKGVMLSHHNIVGTVEAVDQVVQIDGDDVLLGVLPIFHSFGYLATMWLPMITEAKVVFHPNPLDSRQIGELAEQHKATILFATPTFLRSYMKRCTPEQFATLNLVVVGAEKLPTDLAEQYREKYGILPQEGYGATETTGPAAVNVPDHRCQMVHQKGTKLGTVGRPLPGVVAKILDIDSGELLPVNKEGLVHLKGPNIMLGYFHQPEKTAEVLKDGWYNTGDMGFLDEEGFLHVTGRMNRFSKIGGEMVPHLRIEDELLKIVALSNGSPVEGQGPPLAVTSLPDPKKGERIIVLHLPFSRPVGDILNELGNTGLPNLWLPSNDSFFAVEQIPLLGTGKLDLRGIKQLAQKVAESVPS